LSFEVAMLLAFVMEITIVKCTKFLCSCCRAPGQRITQQLMDAFFVHP